MQTKPLFKGISTALITPFQNGRVDYAALAHLVEYQLEGGVRSIVFCGTTGESATLSSAEKQAVFAFAKEEFGERLQVIAGCGGADTASVTTLCRMAEGAGADGILTVTPYYNKPTEEGIFCHYQALCEAVTLPIIAYSVPSRTGVGISPRLWKRLSALPNLAGIKDAGGNLANSARLLLESDKAVYSGNDDCLLPTLAVGGMGGISVLSNLLPARMTALCEAFWEGDLKKAAQLQRQLLPLCDALFAETNPIPIKWALSRLGFCKASWRLPLTAPSKETQKLLETAMEAAGVL